MKFLFATTILLTSCVTQYQPKGFTGGYEDMALKDDVYVVNFQGNGYTSPLTVEAYAHRRARELCEEHGFNDYELLDSRDSSGSSYIPGRATCQSAGRVNGGYYNGSTTCTSSPGFNIHKPGVTLHIRCIQPEDVAETPSEGGSPVEVKKISDEM